MFALIATLGGCVGALFVACNKRLDLFRARYLSGPRRRFIEASDHLGGLRGENDVDSGMRKLSSFAVDRNVGKYNASAVLLPQ